MRRPSKSFVPHPFPYHAEIELEIESLSNLGHGVGRVDAWVVFVPFSLPGERVRARVYRNTASYSSADLVEILRPSPDRVAPECRYFTVCGGCQYQNLSYPAQLEWKRRQVRELFEHMAGLPVDVDPVVPSPREYGYRSKITPHFQAPKDGRIEAIGFLRPGSHKDVVDIEECPIAAPELNAAFRKLRAEVLENAADYRRGATLLLRRSEGEPPVVTDPNATAVEQVGPLEFHFPAGEFFQNNSFLLGAFASHVRDEASAGSARYLLDTYCGSGLFCLTAASAFDKSIGVEVSRSSIRWAKENAERNGIQNAEFYIGKAETIFPRYAYPGPETAVVIDPPRKGCDPVFLERLFAFRPGRVVYVSCNPPTQVRDIRLFVDHGFSITRVQPFDLFPQTRHLECVTTLVR
jgi:23S rRNA (uracil1939-C5)-methyltransferase/tRNA (uracil-5-)-methyltransferase